MLPMFIEPGEISPALLRRLGRIVTRWAFVEMMEQEFLSFLLDADPGAMYVVSQSVAARTITDWCRTLAQFRISDIPTAGRVADLLATVDEVRAERNTLIHGVWEPGPRRGTAIVQTVRWERREIVRGDLTTAADLDDLIERIEEIAGEFLSLGGVLGFLSQDWRTNPPRRR